MKIRLASEIEKDSIVNGDGIRTVIWMQGCPHNCLGCHNRSTHDFDGGFLKDIEDLKEEIKNIELQDGITLSGGDPLLQIDACLEIAKFCKSINLNVWCYTGYTYEELIIMAKSNEKIIEFLNYIDILVDGKFILKEKSFDVKFRGSKNQRLIDIPKTLKEKKIVLYDNIDITTNNFKKRLLLYV